MVEADLAVWPQWFDVAMSIISPVFGHARSRKAAFDYVQALLRADGRRSCWQLAELAGHASQRRLQALLADYDRFDAFVLADTLRTDRARLAPLAPDDPATVALRRACRARKDLISHRVGLDQPAARPPA